MIDSQSPDPADTPLNTPTNGPATGPANTSTVLPSYSPLHGVTQPPPGAKMLEAADVVQAPDRPEKWEDMTAYGWPGWALLIGLSAEMWEALREKQTRPDIDAQGNPVKVVEEKNMRATVVALGLHNSRRERMFVGEAGIAAINKKSNKSVQHAYDVIAELSGMGAAARERMEKNSGQTRSGSSSSPLQSNGSTAPPPNSFDGSGAATHIVST